MRIHGKCHCGNVSFDLAWEPDPETIPARACGCTFCRKHGGVWTSNPAGHLAVTIRDAGDVSKYRFGTSTADFHVCRRCGVVPVVTSVMEGRTYAVVNVNAFEDIDPSRLERTPASFEGEGTQERIERRKRGWIRDVRFVERSTAEGERDIRQLVATWLSATRTGDLETILGLMTDDAVFLIPGRPPMGKKEFADASRTPPGMQMAAIEGESDIQEIRIAGEWAWMWARLSVAMTPPGGQTIEREGHTMTILRRIDGRWKLARDANLLAPVQRKF